MSVSVKEEYHNNGALRRRRCYNADGDLHCESGPAEEAFYKNGTPQYRNWYRHGEFHRVNGPAEEVFHENGMLKMRRWIYHDEIHRDNGPASEDFYENGALAQRTWHRHDKLHREDGPAIEQYREDGGVKAVFYCLDGERVSQEEHRRRVALRKLTTSVAGKMDVSL